MADHGIGDPQDIKATDSTSSWTVISLLKAIMGNGGGGGGGGGAVTIADAADVTEGAIADAAVTAGATGTVSAKLRSISRDVGTVATASATQATAAKQDTGNTSLGTIATNSGTQATAANQTTGNTSLSNIDTNAGASSDAAVTAGATGSISAKLRAISRDIVANIVLKAGSAIIGQVGVDQTTPGTTDSVTVKASSGIGSLTETAPATDTASSGLNGRLQRIAQRLTSLIAQIPAALGQTTKSASMSVTLASDYTAPIVGTVLNATTANVTTNGQDAVASVDVRGYSTVVIQVTGSWTGTLSPQASNDNSTFVTPMLGASIGTSAAASTITANGIYMYPITAAFFRLRATATMTGTVVSTVYFSTLPLNLLSGIYVNAATNFAIIGTTTAADGAALSSRVASISLGATYNGATADMQRGNIGVTALASAARTASANADVVTYNAKTFRVILNITVAPNTASTLTLSIREKDSISSNYITVLTGAAELGTSDTAAVPVTKTYAVGAGLVTTANVSASEALARTMNVLVTHSNADSWTYSVSIELGV